jgi:hypothetical protein
MRTEKKFFRVRLADTCAAETKMVNGMTLTKRWQVKVGEIGDFSKFPDVEAQAVMKRGNGFVPAEEASGGADEEVDGPQEGNGNPARPGGNQTANTGNSAGGSTVAPDFVSMTVEQLKNFLIAKGAAQSELRNTTKPELIERAEFVWSRN